MALYKVLKPTSEVRIGIWKLTESIDELEQLVSLSDSEKVLFQSFKNNRRKKEWLGVRALLKHFGSHKIFYDDIGRPYLKNGDFISISHTKGWAALVISTIGDVGIDVETVSEKAVRSSSKYINAGEWRAGISFLSEGEYYTLIWACKEAVYKKYSRQKTLEFKSEIMLDMIHGLRKKGLIKCSIQLNNNCDACTIDYSFFEGLVLVYALND
ncbi:MAG: 4'-phosphopantetheinyl transferase family protein [Salibacteraceae bacterium]